MTPPPALTTHPLRSLNSLALHREVHDDAASFVDLHEESSNSFRDIMEFLNYDLTTLDGDDPTVYCSCFNTPMECLASALWEAISHTAPDADFGTISSMLPYMRTLDALFSAMRELNP